MVKKTVIVEAKTDGAEKSIDKLKKSTDNLTESTDELSGSLDKVTGGAISKFKGLRDSVKNVAKGFKGLRAAVISTGIGALVVGVVSLIQAFKRSEAGQNKFSKLMGMIGAVTSVILDRMANLGTAIINVFTNPIQSLKDFAANLKSFVVDKVKNVLDGIGLLGSAIKKVFTGDFSGALTDAKDGFVALNSELNPAVIVTKALVKETSNLVKEMKEEAKIAGQIADQRAEADKLERQLIVSRAKADRERAELLEKAVDRENFTTEQRIEFLKEAGRVEEQITNQEIEAARLRLEAKQAENALGLSTKEDLDEEAQLKANLIQLETARLTKQKEVTSQTIALINEQRAAEKAIQDEKDAEQIERDKLEAERQAQLDADKKARDERVLASELDIENRRIAAKKKVVDQAIALFGAETAAGKAALIAKQLLNAQELIAEARKTITFSSLVAARSSAAVAEGTAQTAKVGFPQNIPMLIGYALQAVGIIGAITQAVGKSKSVAGGLGGGSAPSVTPTAPRAAAQSQSVPPAFNIVGASGTNQLAEAIGGQSQQPVKAFVVSNDVSTAQELDRNIVEGASIG
jgi:hypothetical protein